MQNQLINLVQDHELNSMKLEQIYQAMHFINEYFSYKKSNEVAIINDYEKAAHLNALLVEALYNVVKEDKKLLNKVYYTLKLLS